MCSGVSDTSSPVSLGPGCGPVMFLYSLFSVERRLRTKAVLCPFVRFLAALRAPVLLCSGACLLAGCIGDEHVGQGSERVSGAPLSPLVFDEPSGSSGDGGTEESEPPTQAELDAADSSSTAYEILVDPPRTVSLYCGDGVHDPWLEECDDGFGTEPDLCSTNCQTRDLLVVPLAENDQEQSRRLGLGRHPLSLARTHDTSGRTGVGVLSWIELGSPRVDPGEPGSAPRVMAQMLDRHGNPTERLVIADASGDGVDGEELGHPTSTANPVSVALPDGSVAVFYNDLNGDGDELGIGMRHLTPEESGWRMSELSFANHITLGAQQDPDAVRSGDSVVVAWLDSSDASTGPDIHYRTYGPGLGSGSDGGVLAATENPEGAVALAAWPSVTSDGAEHSWVATWRESLPDGSEAIGVFHHGVTVRIRPAWVDGLAASLDGGEAEGSVVEPLMPGHADDRPAVAPLDDSHVAVAFTVGTDPEGTGVANVFRLWVAVVAFDSGKILQVGPVDPMAPATTGDAQRSMRQPALVAVTDPVERLRAPGQVYLSWRSEGALGDSNGEDLWLKRLDWLPTPLNDLSLGLEEVPLPRTTAAGALDHDPGDQRTPALASMPVPGESALGMAWEDFAGNFGDEQAQPDIALQVAPLPLRRGESVEVDCSWGACGVGEGPCSADSDCQAGLSCLERRGPWFDYGVGTAVCAPASCTNGELDGDETDVDCGGSCGRCFDCLGPEYAGTAHYCSAVCSCENLSGDCDSAYDCHPDLVCEKDVGTLRSLPEPIDLCLYGHCTDGELNADEHRLDCGGMDCLPCDNGSEEFCIEQPCLEGEGDCAVADASCASGLVCEMGQGPIYGLSPDIGVCVAPACSGERGTPNTSGFCTADCRCPDGVGLCSADEQCLSDRCEEEMGVYFGLDSEAALCMPDKCFNGQKNVGESQVDCGGVCGTECPACEVDIALSSLEDPTLWGQPTWDGQGTITQLGGVSSGSEATHGTSSLEMTFCDFQEIHSVPLDGGEFAVVGDELLVDLRFEIGDGGNTWDWLGAVGVELSSPSLGLVTLEPETSYSRDDAGQWITLRMPVSPELEDLLLSGEPGIVFRLRVNRNCNIAGAWQGAVLLDNFRFRGDAVFRSDCEPVDNDTGGTGGAGGSPGGGGGTGGSTGGAGGSPGGSGGTGGSTGGVGGSPGGSGGTGGSTGGAGGSSGGSGGTGGSTGGAGGSPGGSGGTGGAPQTTAERIFSFDELADWMSSQTTLVSNAEATEGEGSLQIPDAFAELFSSEFPATDVSVSDRILLDLKVPQSVSGQNLGGGVDVHVSCPSVALWDHYVGSIGFWDKPSDLWLSGAVTVPQSVRDALATTAQDCSIKLRVDIYNSAGGEILLDHLRFAPPSVCTTYTQVASPPFSLGMPVAPDGSAEHPWPLCSVNQVQHVIDAAHLWDDHFALSSNIDLSSAVGQIGSAAQPFSGTFDGQFYTLYDYQLAGADDAGLFGVVQGDGNLDGFGDGVIADLIVSNFSVSGGSRVGAVAGSFDGRAERVVALDTTVTGTTADVGGLFGHLQGTALNCAANAWVVGTSAAQVGGLAGNCDATIYGASTSGTVTLSGSGGLRVGGLCGDADGLIQDSAASSDITANGGEVGGLVGRNVGDVVHSVAHGTVLQQESATRVGGLVGHQWGGSVLLSFSDGDVASAGGEVGGLIGRAVGCAIEDGYATGAIEASDTAGGLLGSMESATLSRTYSRGMVSGGAATGGHVGSRNQSSVSFSYTSSSENPSLDPVGSGSNDGITAVSDSQLIQQSTYESWDFSNVWFLGTSGAELR